MDVGDPELPALQKREADDVFAPFDRRFGHVAELRPLFAGREIEDPHHAAVGRHEHAVAIDGGRDVDLPLERNLLDLFDGDAGFFGLPRSTANSRSDESSAPSFEPTTR